MVVNILLIVVGFIFLVKGADWLVDGASDLAKKMHIPEIIIGLTIVSIGTSMPELFVSTTSSIDGQSDMAIGNVVGSNICNLLLILGLSSVIRPVIFKKETRLIEIPMCLAFSIIFLILCNTGAVINRIEAGLLVALFVGFISYTIYMAKKGEQFDKDGKSKNKTKETNKNSTKDIKIWKCILFIVVGIIALKFGGDFTVDNAKAIAERFNISEKIISITILAIGTSLPELVTSVTAAIKGNSDIAIGNIIGSNIFNMLLIIGVSAIINPLQYNVSYNIDMGFLIVGTIVLALFPIIPPKNEMSRSNGIAYLLMYVAYMLTMFMIR